MGNDHSKAKGEKPKDNHSRGEKRKGKKMPESSTPKVLHPGDQPNKVARVVLEFVSQDDAHYAAVQEFYTSLRGDKCLCDKQAAVTNLLRKVLGPEYALRWAYTNEEITQIAKQLQVKIDDQHDSSKHHDSGVNPDTVDRTHRSKSTGEPARKALECGDDPKKVVSAVINELSQNSAVLHEVQKFYSSMKTQDLLFGKQEVVATLLKNVFKGDFSGWEYNADELQKITNGLKEAIPEDASFQIRDAPPAYNPHRILPSYAWGAPVNGHSQQELGPVVGVRRRRLGSAVTAVPTNHGIFIVGLAFILYRYVLRK